MNGSTRRIGIAALVASFGLAACNWYPGLPDLVHANPAETGVGGVCAADVEGGGAALATDLISNTTSQPIEITNIVLDSPDGVELFGARLTSDGELGGAGGLDDGDLPGFEPTTIQPGETLFVRRVLTLADGAAEGTALGSWVEGRTANGIRFRQHTCFALRIHDLERAPDQCEMADSLIDAMYPLCGDLEPMR